MMLDISNSYLYIEGEFTPNDPAARCYLFNNALAFLFDEIQYETDGEKVAIVRKPGITLTMKIMMSHGLTDLNVLLGAGWGLTQAKLDIPDVDGHIFNGGLPHKYLRVFAEDYTKDVLNAKQVLILIIALSFQNSYIDEVDALLQITKIEWKVRHIVPKDRLFNRISRGGNNAKVKMVCRMWDLYELPTLGSSSSEMWAVETTNGLERPRFIIIGFQGANT